MTPSKILIVRLRRAGDIIMTTPAVTLLRKHFPAAKLAYLVEEPFRRLVEGNPDLDRVIAVSPKPPFADFIRLIREVRHEAYDILIDLHGGPRASWITFWSGAKVKAGYEIKGKRFLYDVRVSRRGTGGPVHSVQNHANLVRALGAEFDDSEIPPLSLPAAKPEEAERVRVVLEEAGAMPDEVLRFAQDGTTSQKCGNAGKKETRVVVLHIGAGNRFRDWGKENLAALIKLLAALPNVRIALVGADADRGVQDEILAGGAAAVLPLAGRLNLIEVRELIRRAALFVGPDSGPMHLAASTETPIVAYFGPTLPAHFAPWPPSRTKTVILQKDLPCRPCPQRECVTDDFRCLLTIGPDEVFAACRPFLL